MYEYRYIHTHIQTALLISLPFNFLLSLSNELAELQNTLENRNSCSTKLWNVWHLKVQTSTNRGLCSLVCYAASSVLKKLQHHCLLFTMLNLEEIRSGHGAVDGNMQDLLSFVPKHPVRKGMAVLPPTWCVAGT